MPLELRLKITDVKTGHVDLDIQSRSFVLQFAQILCGNMKASLVQTVRDITNTARAFGITNIVGGLMDMGPPGVAQYNTEGIQVGTSNTAEATTDVALGSLVAHGTGAGNLFYSNSGFVTPVNLAGTLSAIWNRTVENQSLGAITIREVGIYCLSNFAGAVGSKNYCLIRDVIPDLAVAVGAIKLIQYILQTVN